jgi:hypothetical protein
VSNRKRNPTTPGEILQGEFLTPLKITQKELADHPRWTCMKPKRGSRNFPFLFAWPWPV